MPIETFYAWIAVVLGKGKVIASGAPEEVRNDKRVLDAYLG